MFDCNCVMCGCLITEEGQSEDSNCDIISVHTMIDDKSFWYGLSGVFEFIQPPPGLNKDDEICSKCMALQKDNIKPALTIKCYNCGELHQACYAHSKNQGWGCAATVVCDKNGELMISAGWGSQYDCSVFRINSLVLKLGDLVCDKCIAIFVENGALIEYDYG